MGRNNTIKFLGVFFQSLDRKGIYFLFICLLMTLITSICVVLQPLFLTKIINAYETSKSIWPILLVAVTLHVLGRIVSETRWFFIGYPEEKAAFSMKTKYLYRMLEKDINFFNKNAVGELTNRISGVKHVIFSVSKNLFFHLLPLLINLITLLIVVYLNFSIKYLIILFLSLLLYVFFLFLGSNYLDEKSKIYINSFSKSFSTLTDILTNRKLLRSYNSEKYGEAKYKDALDQNIFASLKDVSRRGFFGLVQALIILVAIVTTLLTSVYDLMGNLINLGNFILINTYILQLLSPLENLSKIFREIRGATVNITLLDEILDCHDEIKFGDKKISIKKGVVIEFKNVSLKYPNSKEFVLKNISFKIPANSFVVIMGKSGSGKSSVISLLLRFVAPTSGKILLNDIPIEQLSRENFHKCFANIGQTTHIMNDTINNNISLGSSDFKDRELKEICKRLNINTQIEKLDNKFDEIIGMHDKKLSEGQLQRLAIIRGFLSKAPILYCDEITSSLDSINERIVLDCLKELNKKQSVLLITHKVEHIKKADIVFTISNGELQK